MVSESLKKAVNKGDILEIRSVFYTIILSDPYFKTSKFDEALEYAQNKCKEELVDNDDGEELKPESEWNEEYFDLLISKLQDNFSIERINNIKVVVKYLKDTQEHDRKKSYVTCESECKTLESNNSVKMDLKDSVERKSNTTGYKTTLGNDADCLWVAWCGIIIAGLLFIRHLFKENK